MIHQNVNKNFKLGHFTKARKRKKEFSVKLEEIASISWPAPIRSNKNHGIYVPFSAAY